MLPASLAALVPVFIATPTSACASAGASFVPSPVIATSLPLRLLVSDELHLRLGRRLGEEVVDAGLLGDDGRRDRVVAGDHDRADAHRAQLLEPLADAALHDVLEVDDARAPALPRETTSGVPPVSETLRTSASRSSGTVPPSDSTHATTASRRALADLLAVDVDAAHARLRGERDERRASPRRGAARGCRTASRAPRSSGPRASRRRATRAARRRRAPPR